VRYLILTDLHANLPALEAVLADAAAIGYDAVLVLGDLVGYGGDPAAVLERTLALKPVGLIRGNHDKVCAGIEPSTSFNDVAKISIEWTAAILSAAHLKTLAELPIGPQHVPGDVEIAHGAPFDEDYYVFDTLDAARALDAASARICLVGHTHVPAVFAVTETPLSLSNDGVLALPPAGGVLVNVGSVGQPRDGDPRAAYGLLDLGRKTLSLRRVAYDVGRAQQSILDAGLPPWLAWRLEQGQ
jgi:diadenosine tetraphosphatase ApaH/serine/threonine PP2A family protein phosphatase